jgi:hypothetical protein
LYDDAEDADDFWWSYVDLPDPTLSFPTISYPILPYPILPYPTLSYPTLSFPFLPCLAIAMVPRFLLEDGGDMKDGNSTFSPMLGDSLVSFFLWRFDPISGNGLPWKGFVIKFVGHTTLGRNPLDEWSAPSDNTQLSQERNIHALGGIRTLNPSKRMVADLRLNVWPTGSAIG